MGVHTLEDEDTDSPKEVGPRQKSRLTRKRKGVKIPITGYKYKLSTAKISRLQHEFELGLSSKTALAKKYKITRSKIWELAAELDWEYAGRREELLKRFEEKSFARLNNQRVDAVEQHAIELQLAREALKEIKTPREAEMLEKRVDILLKCIKGERTAYGLPNEFRQIETKNENVFRVEEMVKSLDLKKQELKVINPIAREIKDESNKEGRQGINEFIDRDTPKREDSEGIPEKALFRSRTLSSNEEDREGEEGMQGVLVKLKEG